MNRRPGSHVPARFLHEAGGRAEVNPHREGHRQFGSELVPADEAEALAGDWARSFGREAPLHVELGTGHGSWLAAAAAAHPERDWLGVEIRYKRCVQTATRLRGVGATNGRVVRYSWFALDRLLRPASVAAFYIHHPDPWPAEREKKHRLIEPGFVGRVAEWLEPGGELRLKTDFPPHATALLAAVRALPFSLLGHTTDLAATGAPWPDDVVTGYQARFHAQGVPIHAVWLRRHGAVTPGVD